jgi:hypothetical protein
MRADGDNLGKVKSMVFDSADVLSILTEYDFVVVMSKAEARRITETYLKRYAEHGSYDQDRIK